nr:hypothetical protein L204_04863 [Cryptococcus depauperatus CBS 7855]
MANRRSDTELQEILDTFVGTNKTVLTGSLPQLIAGYERDNKTKILGQYDYESVCSLCQQYPDLELGPTELFDFLMAVLKSLAEEPYPTPDTATPSTAQSHSTPQQNQRHHRRHSDRVRSPSDSSSTSSSDEDDTRQRRQVSAPPITSAFPSSSSTQPSPSIGGFALPVRKKTLSDPNHSDGSVDSPAPVRMVRNRANPPSAFTGGFARPSPAGRRRRGSASAQGEGDLNSPDLRNLIKRSFSSSSERVQSPQPYGRPVSRQSRPSTRPPTPLSPVDLLDKTSFHESAKSPIINSEREDDHLDSEAMFDLDRVEEGEDCDERESLKNTVSNDPLMPRLSRISSSASLRTSHEQLQRLRKENSELSRKLKETEKSLAVQGAENERMVEDLQARLEEAHSEIAQRRKDEKDMRGKDRAQLIQISGFEADIQSLQRGLDNAKANHAGMQKMYNSQCDEAQRLRDLLRDRDLEIRNLEDAANAHAADEEKLTHEIQALETEIKRLEGDISFARQAESHLQTQKQENLALKETIDRMRFDLDEARAAVALIGTGAGRGTASAGTDSAGGSIAKNLGDELGRRLVDVVKEETHEDEDEEGSYVETIVTTQRTRKRAVWSHSQAGSSSAPVMTIEEGIREYVDASTATDASLLDSPTSPPAYTAEPPPVDADQVLQQAHPKIHKILFNHKGTIADGEEDYEALVDALGVRCTVLEEGLKMKRLNRAKNGEPHVRHRKRQSWTESQSPGIVQYIFNGTSDVRDNVGRFAVFAVAAFAFGVIAGSHLLGPSATGLHPRDYKLFQQMNTLAGAAGVGEGFLPAHMLGVVENGARLVAGRIPT